MHHFHWIKLSPPHKVLRSVNARLLFLKEKQWRAGYSTAAGFTLFEILVTLAILGILASIAYPSYQSSVIKTRRSDGISGLLMLQVAQERFRSNCPFYAGKIGVANVCGKSAASSTVQAASSSHKGHYMLSIAEGTASADSYTILAMPHGSQAKDSGCAPMYAAYSPDHPNGRRTPESCW